jgi:hypothetical protein
MNLKDKRTFLLNGALLALLLFCSLSSVAAADIANDTQTVCGNSSQIEYDNSSEIVCDNSSLNVEINKTDTEINTDTSQNAFAVVFDDNTKVELSDIKTDRIIIKNNENKITLTNITCDVLIVEDSAVSYINIYHSNIKKLIIKHTTVSSLFFDPYIVDTTIGSLIIEDSNLTSVLNIRSSIIQNFISSDSYINYIDVSDRSQILFGEQQNSHIKTIDVRKDSEGESLDSVSKLIHDANSHVSVWGHCEFF